MEETIGRRIAVLRQKHGWTQQALSARLGISRVAVSHIEMDLSIPGERTITLLAGLFKTTPTGLVENTTYPIAKAERLPLVCCTHTEIEVELALLENDLKWLDRLEGIPGNRRFIQEVKNKWTLQLARRSSEWIDEREKEMLEKAQHKLRELDTSRKLTA